MHVSILIPTRNRKALLKKAVLSVAAQKLPSGMPDPEIVVADDGSTDGTRRMLEARFPHVRIVSSPSLGPGGARNLAAQAATGEIFMFLDSDDTFRPHHVARLASPFAKGASWTAGITENRNLLDNSTFLTPEPGALQSGRVFSPLVRWCHVMTSTMAVRREAFLAAGGFPDLQSGQDWLFFLSLADRYPLVFVNEILTDRLLHQDSISARHTKSRLKSLHDAARHHLDRLSSTTRADLLNLEQKRQLIQKKGDQWHSTQDFYTAARKAGLTAL